MINYNKLSKKELIELLVREKSEPILDSDNAVETMRKLTKNFNQENFVMIILNTANKIISSEVLFVGGTSSMTIDQKIIFNKILKTKRASRIIVGHNHPSGNLNPSPEDKLFTQKLKEGCKIFDIKLLDSIIYTEFSFRSIIDD